MTRGTSLRSGVKTTEFWIVVVGLVALPFVGQFKATDAYGDWALLATLFVGGRAALKTVSAARVKPAPAPEGDV